MNAWLGPIMPSQLLALDYEEPLKIARHWPLSREEISVRGDNIRGRFLSFIGGDIRGGEVHACIRSSALAHPHFLKNINKIQIYNYKI